MYGGRGIHVRDLRIVRLLFRNGWIEGWRRFCRMGDRCGGRATGGRGGRGGTGGGEEVLAFSYVCYCYKGYIYIMNANVSN